MNARVETLRIGIIGTGNIGTSHARSLAREVSGAEVAWLYDADTARASALADELGANVAPSVEQLVASSDAVVIASPDDLHAQQALLCLDAQRLCQMRDCHAAGLRPVFDAAATSPSAASFIQLAHADTVASDGDINCGSNLCVNRALPAVTTLATCAA